MYFYLSSLRRLRPSKRLKEPFNQLRRSRDASSSAADVKQEEIIIPERIPRGPTDILQALANTVGRDPTAPHFKYHDDPYLIPLSNQKKRVYALAQESGRKAAHWLRQEHREYFLYTVLDPPLKQKTPYQNAEPPIEAFVPKPVYGENSEVTEEDLKIVMKSSLVSDARIVYSLLESKNPNEISPQSKQEFLELLCFFNEEDPIGEEWIEEKWFRQGKWIGNERNLPMWKDKSLAESIFANMEEKTPEAYCALIQGMCKHFQAEKAYALYQECLQNNIALNTDVFNGLLSVVGFLKEGNEMRWQLILELLGQMNSMGLKPTLGTLNSILQSFTSINSSMTKGRCLSVLSEFVKKCGIEPSLGSWYYVLNIFCKDKGSKSDILNVILEKIEGKEWTIRDPKDTYFFVNAMNVCRYHLQDLNLAKRVHQLLLHGSNYNLIGDSFKENSYYRNYFSLHCRYEPLDSFMELYYDLVPNVYIPEPSVMEEILKTLDSNGAVEHYPLIWSHIVMFGHFSRLSILQFILESMVRNLPPKDTEESSTVEDNTESKRGSNLHVDVKTLSEALRLEMGVVKEQYGEEYKTPTVEETFANIAWDLWNKFEEQPELLNNRLRWTGSMLGDIAELLIRVERFEDCSLVVKKLCKSMEVSGVPTSPQTLIDYAKLMAEKNQLANATMALTYLSESGYVEASNAAKDVLQMHLNKPAEEIEVIVNKAMKNENTELYNDNIVASLLSVATQSVAVKASPKMNSSSQSDSSETSSSDSDSESSDDDIELPEPQKQE